MNEEFVNKEKRVLEHLAQGSEAAFRLLYDNHHQRVYSFALFLTHSEVLAEEVTQEIFIKIWNHRSELSEIQHFDAWLKTIVRNQCYTYLNRLAKERLVLQELSNQELNGQGLSDTGLSGTGLSGQGMRGSGFNYHNIKASESADERVIFNEYYHLLQQALRSLPEQQRKVFILSRREGIKNEEIARQMGLSINTIKSHMKAALKKMRLIVGSQALGLMAIIGRTLLDH